MDKNHLISIGVTRNKHNGGYYRNLHSLKTIDLLDFHDYGSPEQQIPEELKNSFTDAKYLDKPLIIGEAGTYPGERPDSKFLEEKIKSYFDPGGSVYILWSYGNGNVTDDGHNFDNTDPLASIIKNLATGLNK